jgi:hypothetical protein
MKFNIMSIALPQVQSKFQKHIDKVIVSLLKRTPYRKLRKEVRGHIAIMERGMASYQHNLFFVPYWAFYPRHPKNVSSNGGYFIYYVAHELSHILAYKKHGVRCGHDPRFTEIFETICPKEHQHFEEEYKVASNYGVRNT